MPLARPGHGTEKGPGHLSLAHSSFIRRAKRAHRHSAASDSDPEPWARGRNRTQNSAGFVQFVPKQRGFLFDFAPLSDSAYDPTRMRSYVDKQRHSPYKLYQECVYGPSGLKQTLLSAYALATPYSILLLSVSAGVLGYAMCGTEIAYSAT
eukprot:3940308-Rhodomonas_salina.4